MNNKYNIDNKYIVIYSSICLQLYILLYSLDEINYSLVLEYADGGTLGKYSDDAIILKWEIQLKFAKEITSAILCLHDNDIIHRDIVSLNNNIIFYNYLYNN